MLGPAPLPTPLPTSRWVMGVVNVTPDSFSDGGRYLDPDVAVAHGLELAAAGAHVVDVGGESTRPGAVAVAPAEELGRVVPVVEALVAAGVAVSVDTTKATVAEAALAAGAVIVNDVSGGDDPALVAVVAEARCGYVVMHHAGIPAGSRPLPSYDDVVEAVGADLVARAGRVLEAGVAADRLVVDPGLGFGKGAAGSLALLARLDELVDRVGRPVLVGPSRKSFLGAATGLDTDQREEATLAAVVWAFERGAAGVRVHDARAAARVVALLDVLDRATGTGMLPPGPPSADRGAGGRAA